MPAFKAATFDCYGTLIDWEGGAAAFLYSVARDNGDRDAGPAHELRRRWEEIQFEHIQGDYRDYSELLKESLRAWVAERGYRWNVNTGYEFSRSMQTWQPFPDTIPALTRVREAGIPLAIVSNSEHSIIDHTLGHLRPLEFDPVVLAEEVRAYKPERRPFTRVLDKLGLAPEDVLHVAFGFKYDIGMAKELGMQTAWINRHREPLPDQDLVPNHEWRDLWGLAELIERD